jgi:hypothetical protein
VVGYHYGFPSTIGAGGFDRRLPGKQAQVLAPVQDVSGGGATFASAPGRGTVRLRDSRTYTSVPAVITVDAGERLVITAENKQRPVVRLAPATTWTFVGQADANGAASELVVDGLLLCGCDVVLRGVFEKVTLRTCTIDPGNSPDGVAIPNAADGVALAPGHLLIEGSIRHLEIDRCVLGPIGMDPDPTKAEVESVTISDSIVQSVLGTEHAIDLRTGMADVVRTTFLGLARFHRLEASNAIFDDVAIAVDAQHGCTRFCAFPNGSQLPRPYACVQIAPAQELFVSRAFGSPAYAQLLESVSTTISEGADNGSEMGAYCRENVAIKERSLLVKFQEYMPVGMTPVLIYVT